MKKNMDSLSDNMSILYHLQILDEQFDELYTGIVDTADAAPDGSAACVRAPVFSESDT